MASDGYYTEDYQLWIVQSIHTEYSVRTWLKVASPINKCTEYITEHVGVQVKMHEGDDSAEPLVQGQGGGTNWWPSLPENYLIGLEGMKRWIPIESGLRDRRGYFLFFRVVCSGLCSWERVWVANEKANWVGFNGRQPENNKCCLLSVSVRCVVSSTDRWLLIAEIRSTYRGHNTQQ